MSQVLETPPCKDGCPVSGRDAEERTTEAGIGAHPRDGHRLNFLRMGGGGSGPF